MRFKPQLHIKRSADNHAEKRLPLNAHFTYDEAKDYLNYVLDTYVGLMECFDEIWNIVISNYDGYKFTPDGQKLFNSTILTYVFYL